MLNSSLAIATALPVTAQGNEQNVDARRLHAFLEIETRFNDWFDRRVEEYGFSATKDFYSNLSKRSGGRPSTEYTITLGMAKELCMVERNEKGREARRYFIECEKQLRESLAKPALVLTPHLQRILCNQGRVPIGHFSMLEQMSELLLRPMEEYGYTLPANMVPDISLGRMFCDRLKEKGFPVDDLPTYWHKFIDGRPPVKAKLYPVDMLAEFQRLFIAWMKERSVKYFRERDNSALEPLSLVEEKMRALPARYRKSLAA